MAEVPGASGWSQRAAELEALGLTRLNTTSLYEQRSAHYGEPPPRPHPDHPRRHMSCTSSCGGSRACQ